MNFHSAKKKKEQQKLGLTFAIVAGLIALGFSGFYRWFSTGIHPLASTFWNIRDGQNTSFSFIVKDKKHLEKRIQELETELLSKDLEIMRLQMFREENAQLKDILTTEELYNPKTAGILVKPNYTLYDSLIIDTGSQEGVRVGDLVVGYGSVVLGKIVDVRKNISYVELTTEDNISSILVHSKTGTYVDAVGQGGGMVKFTIPRDVTVEIGDILSLPSRIGFLFGAVEDIQFDSTDPVQTVFAQSAVNINQLQYVEVIPGYEEQF